VRRRRNWAWTAGEAASGGRGERACVLQPGRGDGRCGSSGEPARVGEIGSRGTRAGRVRDGGRMGEIMMDGRSLRRARVAKQSLAVSSPLLSRVPVILDYTPYVGHMIPADDGWRRPRLRQTRGAAARTDVVAGRIREKFECVCRCPGCAE